MEKNHPNIWSPPPQDPYREPFSQPLCPRFSVLSGPFCFIFCVLEYCFPKAEGVPEAPLPPIPTPPPSRLPYSPPTLSHLSPFPICLTHLTTNSLPAHLHTSFHTSPRLASHHTPCRLKEYSTERKTTTHPHKGITHMFIPRQQAHVPTKPYRLINPPPPNAYQIRGGKGGWSISVGGGRANPQVGGARGVVGGWGESRGSPLSTKGKPKGIYRTHKENH